MKYLSKLFLVLSIVIVQNSYSQSTVYVQTNQYGRGILKIRGSECFVITPEHLLKKGEQDYNGAINVYGEAGVGSRANLLKSYLGDLSVLQFSGDYNQNCEKWQLHQNYSAVLDNSPKGYLELRESDGSSTKYTVKIPNIDVQYIYIEFEDSNEDFYQGMSGSSLFVDYNDRKVFLGMLQSIEKDDFKEGVSIGKVIRADEMDNLLGSFFNPIKKQKRSNVITDKDLTKEALGFRFELLDIEKSGDRVTFNVDATSLESDKLIRLSNRDILLYDDNGSEYKPIKIFIANKSYYRHNDYVEHKLIKETPVSLKIIFNNVPSSAQFATKFKVGFSNEQSKNSFEFNDLYFGDKSEDLSEVIDKKGNWSTKTLGCKFDLLDYEKKGTDVVFTFTITSLDRDKSVKLSNRNIFLYDNLGSKYQVSNIVVGNSTYHRHNDWVDHELIKDIQTPVIISFKDVAPSAISVSKIDVGFSDDQSESSFDIRGLPFTKKTAASTNSPNFKSVNKVNPNVGKPSTNCSDIYFYRKKGMLECPEVVYLYNHGELLSKLEPGVRFKSIVCDDRPFKFSVKTKPNEIALSNSKPVIELGKKYFLKISCAMGISTISLQESSKGAKDVSNNGKFKRKLVTLPLNKY